MNTWFARVLFFMFGFFMIATPIALFIVIILLILKYGCGVHLPQIF